MTKPKFETTQITMQEVVIPAAGPIAATLYQRIKFFCELNKKQNKKKYFNDGRWWTWQSLSSFEEEYPYWSRMSVKRALDKLNTCGLIITQRTKQFQNSNKYSFVELNEWMMSEDFQSLDKKKRLLVSQVIKKRNIITTSYNENVTACNENVTPNTDIITVIRDNLLEGRKFFTEISTEKQLQMEYNNLVITSDQARSMIDSFGKLFQTTNMNSQDFDNTVRSLYLQNVYSNQYPYWVRLVYGVENSFIGCDVIDSIAPTIKKELDKNPYIIKVLEKLLPESFEWSALGISPNFYSTKWNNLCERVFKDVI
tara:strand:+ start:219 stop:1151 length:933 start_codon:yes stop_codon:yes gene_type:complete